MKPLRSAQLAMPRRWLCLALLCALVLAQSLGLVHKVLHSPAQSGFAFNPGHAHDHAHDNDHANDDVHGQRNNHALGHAHFHPSAYAQPAASGVNWLGALFADHSTESDCRLHDGLSASDAYLLANVSVIPPLLAIFYIAFSRATATACAAALYDARGPPATL